MSMSSSPPAPGTRPAAGELRPLVRLAMPLVAGHAGTQLMSLVDTAMVGRLGKAELGGVGAGNSLYFTIMIFAMGIVLGVEAPINQALGAGDGVRARRAFWQGVRVAALASLPIIALIVASPVVLTWAGVGPAAIEQATIYTWVRSPAVLPTLLFVVCRSYVQARGATRAIVIAMLVSNVINVIGNALLMYGDEVFMALGLPAPGLPRMGVAGAALATVFSQCVALVVLVLAVRALAAPADPERRRPERQLVRTILRLGLPIGATMLAEVGVFGFAGILTGRISDDALAGHQVALTLASFTFTVALGVGSATGVRVGGAVGRGDEHAARRAGMTGIGVATAWMSLSALVFLAIPLPLARLLTNDPQVVAAAIPLLQLAALFQLSDGIQAVGAGALRGAGDPVWPLWANLIGHWAIGLPIALVLGFGLGQGAPGIWWGLTAGLTAVAIGLVVRFRLLTSRPIARV